MAFLFLSLFLFPFFLPPLFFLVRKFLQYCSGNLLASAVNGTGGSRPPLGGRSGPPRKFGVAKRNPFFFFVFFCIISHNLIKTPPSFLHPPPAGGHDPKNEFGNHWANGFPATHQSPSFPFFWLFLFFLTSVTCWHLLMRHFPAFNRAAARYRRPR